MKNPEIFLPKDGPKPSYYAAYVGFVKSILDYNQIGYGLAGTVNQGCVRSPTATKFLMIVDGKRIVIDYSDHIDHMPNWSEFNAYFKFHYSERQKGCNTIYPFSPISFHNWKKYYSLRNEIKYTCTSDTILCMQRPGGSANSRCTFRRTAVKDALKSEYGEEVVTTSKDTQINYWKRISNCLVHVFVPGARNNMLDRGHMQYLAFGCCTIAPPIIDELPFDVKMIDGVNFVQCAEDYSDLIEKIEWCRNNREICIEIGNNAKAMFTNCCTPKVLWNWIGEKI